MCLHDQGIEDNNGGVDRGRRACGLRNNDKGVGGGRGIGDESKGSETTAEAASIWG